MEETTIVNPQQVTEEASAVTPSPINDYPEILSVKDIAKYINTSYSKALNIVKSGSIPTKRFGTNYLVSKASFEKWLEKSDTQNITPGE